MSALCNVDVLLFLLLYNATRQPPEYFYTLAVGTLWEIKTPTDLTTCLRCMEPGSVEGILDSIQFLWRQYLRPHLTLSNGVERVSFECRRHVVSLLSHCDVDVLVLVLLESVIDTADYAVSLWILSSCLVSHNDGRALG